jgi:ADP-ribose pyrophosphatase
MWEIPRGFGESGDSRIDATRELREEIGVEVPPATLVSLGDVHPNSGLLQGKVVLFAADCSGIVLDDSVTDGEVQQFRWVRIDDAFRMAGSGEITDAITLSALLRSRCLGLI